nr:tyrosine-protein phosphatase [Pseudoclavibacter helvolus]
MTTATSLEGTFNFRDTGGMPLAGGGTTTSGIFYRSDALSSLTPKGSRSSRRVTSARSSTSVPPPSARWRQTARP